MGYLLLTRKEGEEIQLSIEPGVNTDKLLHHLLRDWITIRVSELAGRHGLA